MKYEECTKDNRPILIKLLRPQSQKAYDKLQQIFNEAMQRFFKAKNSKGNV